MFFDVVLGALHIDLLPGRKFRADSVKHRGTGRKILSSLGFEDPVRFWHSEQLVITASCLRQL